MSATGRDVTMQPAKVRSRGMGIAWDVGGACKALAVAAALTATASLAGAAPVTHVGDIVTAPGSDVLQVHGFHQSCARDRFGWHRHNEWGERRRCRTWRGRGPRPDFCIRIGGLWICDY